MPQTTAPRPIRCAACRPRAASSPLLSLLTLTTLSPSLPLTVVDLLPAPPSLCILFSMLLQAVESLKPPPKSLEFLPLSNSVAREFYGHSFGRRHETGTTATPNGQCCLITHVSQGTVTLAIPWFHDFIACLSCQTHLMKINSK